MNQEKIGKQIKEFRRKNHLTQQQFAEKYGVTYQAVSKWETGKNIPDILVLKQICNDYQIPLEDFLESKEPKKKRKTPQIIFLLFVLLIFALFFIIIRYFDSNNFEFRTLSSSCDNFEVAGSIAYNDKKSAIYISNISYCGEVNKEKYQKIECTLYETNQNTKIVISRYDYEKKQLISLESFLKQVNFHVDDYMKSCKVYSENSLHLEIDAVNEEGKITSYKIPLTLADDCKK